MNEIDETEGADGKHVTVAPIVRGVASEETLLKLLLGGTTNVRAPGGVFDLVQYMQSFWPNHALVGQSKTKTLATLVSYGIRSLPNSQKILADFEVWKKEVHAAQAEVLAAVEAVEGVKAPLPGIMAAVEAVEGVKAPLPQQQPD